MEEKIPIIPPVFFYHKLITDFEKKAELSDNHSVTQCSLVKNGRSLPNFEYKTDEQLNYFEINENDILSIIKNLNTSKAHGCNKILIRMIKLCSKTIAFRLKLIFQ